MFSKFYRKDYLILMKATKILIIYSLIFILLNSTIVLAEQRNGIYEPLDYLNDNTPLSIAIPSSNAWKTEIAASEINSEWNDNDEFSIVNFDNADMSFDNNNVLTMTFMLTMKMETLLFYCSITKPKTNIRHCRLIFQKQAYLLFNLKFSATEL